MKLVTRNIILYFVADITCFVSVTTTFFTMTWLTFKLTGSPSALGFVGFAQNIPFLFFSTYAGVLADRFDKRKIVITCNLFLILLSLGTILFQWFGLLSYSLILSISFVLGCIISLHFPSMIGIVKEIVTSEKLFPRVMGAASSNAKIGQIISSSVFAIIFSIISATGTFIFAFVSGIISLVSIASVRIKTEKNSGHSAPALNQLFSGLKYFLMNKFLISISLTSTIISIVFCFVIYEMPVIDNEFLKGGSAYLGILYFAGALGGISAGVYLSRRSSTKDILKFFVFCAFLSGFSAIGMAISRELWIDFIFAIGIDFSIVAAIGICNSVLQILTEDSMRGRVIGAYLSLNWGITAIATLMFGFLADEIGTDQSLMIIGVLPVLAGLFYMLSLKLQKPEFEKVYMERNIDPDHRPI